MLVYCNNKENRYHRFFGYLWSVIGYFRFVKYRVGFGSSKYRGNGSVFGKPTQHNANIQKMLRKYLFWFGRE